MASGTSSSQFALPDPPSDAISAIQFSPRVDSKKFLVASWDKNVYVYELGEKQMCTQISKYEHSGPVLDVCFGRTDNDFYTACLDRQVRRIDVSSGQQTILSTHSNGIKSILYSQEHDLVISASWDCTLHIHPGNAPGKSATVELPNKPFALSASSSKLVVAMSSRALNIYELHTFAEKCRDLVDTNTILDVSPWQRRESSLKFMTRAVSCMPNDEGYASSSIEGRVAVEWFDPSNDSQARKYAFKCHRQPIDDVDVVYPVNALAFHAIHGTFATGGGDGVVAIWDAVAKRRIRIYPKLPSSIAGLSFSANGKYLATAISPGFEDGKDDLPEGTIGIYIRELGENEVKRKAK